jgi:hypothetical protein
MRHVCIAVVIVMIASIASPALAQSRRHAPVQRAPQSAYPGVYPGQGRVNTDPDPNVQFEILRQQNWRKGG